MPVAVVVETRDDPGERFVAVAGDLVVLPGLQAHSLLPDLGVEDRRPELHIADTSEQCWSVRTHQHSNQSQPTSRPRK